MADLDPCIGSEQGGIRPVVIIQNNTGNRFSTTTIVAPITTKLGKAYLPTHLVISKRTGIYKKSMILLEQIRIIDKSRLLEKLSIYGAFNLYLDFVNIFLDILQLLGDNK